MDEELIQSRHEEELNNGRPERHFYASPTMMSGNSEEGDLGDTMSSSSQSLNGSEDGDLGDTITTNQGRICEWGRKVDELLHKRFFSMMMCALFHHHEV